MPSKKSKGKAPAYHRPSNDNEPVNQEYGDLVNQEYEEPAEYEYKPDNEEYEEYDADTAGLEDDLVSNSNENRDIPLSCQEFEGVRRAMEESRAQYEALQRRLEYGLSASAGASTSIVGASKASARSSRSGAAPRVVADSAATRRAVASAASGAATPIITGPRNLTTTVNPTTPCPRPLAVKTTLARQAPVPDPIPALAPVSNPACSRRANELQPIYGDSPSPRFTPYPPNQKDQTIARIRAGLGARKNQRWLDMQEAVRQSILRSGLDYSKPWSRQDTAKLGLLMPIIHKRIPGLENFEDHWATMRLIQTKFNHRRGHMRGVDRMDDELAIAEDAIEQDGVDLDNPELHAIEEEDNMDFEPEPLARHPVPPCRSSSPVSFEQPLHHSPQASRIVPSGPGANIMSSAAFINKTRTPAPGPSKIRFARYDHENNDYGNAPARHTKAVNPGLGWDETKTTPVDSPVTSTIASDSEVNADAKAEATSHKKLRAPAKTTTPLDFSTHQSSVNDEPPLAQQKKRPNPSIRKPSPPSTPPSSSPPPPSPKKRPKRPPSKLPPSTSSKAVNDPPANDTLPKDALPFPPAHAASSPYPHIVGSMEPAPSPKTRKRLEYSADPFRRSSLRSAQADAADAAALTEAALKAQGSTKAVKGKGIGTTAHRGQANKKYQVVANAEPSSGPLTPEEDGGDDDNGNEEITGDEAEAE